METRQFLTCGDAMNISSMFLHAASIDPSIVTANRERLEHSYKLSICRELSYEAWGIVFTAIINGETGYEKFGLLPVTVSTSPLCISVLLDNGALFDLALTGKISYYGIVKLAYQKGIWAF